MVAERIQFASDVAVEAPRIIELLLSFFKHVSVLIPCCPTGTLCFVQHSLCLVDVQVLHRGRMASMPMTHR